MVELLLPGHNIHELLLAMLLGIAGALVSEFIGRWADLYGPGDAFAYLVAVLGAITTLVLYGVFSGNDAFRIRNSYTEILPLSKLCLRDFQNWAELLPLKKACPRNGH